MEHFKNLDERYVSDTKNLGLGSYQIQGIQYIWPAEMSLVYIVLYVRNARISLLSRNIRKVPPSFKSFMDNRLFDWPIDRDSSIIGDSALFRDPFVRTWTSFRTCLPTLAMLPWKAIIKMTPSI